MKKRRIIFIVILLSGIIVLAIATNRFLLTEQKATVSNVLSERSKQFIRKEEIEKDASRYSQLLVENENKKGQRYYVGNCFSFIIPFAVTNIRPKEGCSSYYAFERPKGSVVAFMEEAASENFEDASGYQFRMQNPQQYEKIELKIGEISFAGFLDKNANYTVTIYHYISGKFMILTFKAPPDEEKALDEILASLEFY